ncbi:MAG: PLP-dependent aspartate aminotransferase family protein [Candidatus Neomarinimicrobiota bacterium]
MKKWKFSTKSVHIGNDPDEKTGSVSVPIYLTSTYEQDAVGKDRGYDYSRAVNPTRERLEENIAALAGGQFGIAFASGMAAITSIFQLLKFNDHVVISRNVYGGTYRLVKQVLNSQGIDFTFTDTSASEAVLSAIRPETKMMFIETPTNPLLELSDISLLAKICEDHNILLIVDNTFMSPFGQRPLSLGAHLVVHSSTKFIGGHSDVLGGIAVTSDENLGEKLRFIQKSVGAVPSPFDCWLLIRSIKTLPLRAIRQFDTAQQLAEKLSTRKELSRIIYPGLPVHPQHKLAKSQQLDPSGKPVFGSMISIDMGSIESRDRFLKRLKIFILAESLGGVESLVSVPYVMTHGSIPPEEKEFLGLTESLVRLSVGIEDPEDLWNDLETALTDSSG